MPDIVVSSNGELCFKDKKYHCALGQAGLTLNKQEGDGATPTGLFDLRRVFYRPDRFVAPPQTVLPISPLKPTDGWSDDPTKTDYNTLVNLPYDGHHESLWREDEIYDLIVVIGYNDNPVIAGAGSAIFLHLARPDYSPTKGCVALSRPDLLTLLADLELPAKMLITA